MHFWTLVTRLNGGVSRPKKYGINGTMPAIVNIAPGSFEISDVEGTTVCPRLAKKSTQRFEISCESIFSSEVNTCV